MLELDPEIQSDTHGWLRKLTQKVGEPLIRLALRRGMRIIGSVAPNVADSLRRKLSQLTHVIQVDLIAPASGASK